MSTALASGTLREEDQDLMAKKKAAVGRRGKRRGGRKPGTWTLLSPEALRAWRENNKMSRSSVATMLGVSATSVQNWETGHAVATSKMQQRLADLTKAPPSAVRTKPAKATAARTSSGANGTSPHSANGDPTLIQATAAIVVEAIKAGGKRNVSAKDLGLLVRTVRDALA